VLSRQGLKGAIASGQLFIEGLKEESIQPASIDLHLGDKIINAVRPIGAPREVDPFNEVSVKAAFHSYHHDPVYTIAGKFILRPGEFVLVATERVTIGNELVAQVAGKSSLARLGLMVESAGFIDPGFDGCITLELFNQLPSAILLTPGMPIAQLVVTRLDTPVELGYVGKYQGATGPQSSRYYLNRRPE